MKIRLTVVGLAAAALLAWDATCAASSADIATHRLLVLTDITADPDDEQSLVRLLLYTNEIDIEGIVATTSVHKKTDPATATVRKVLRAYGQVWENLLLHDRAYPSEDSLLDLVKTGSPVYGMQGVGDGQDSEGSDWIISALEKDDPRPLWISVWGGVNTLAQALHTIRATRSEADAARLISKLRVYTIADQDDSGSWIRREFPALFYIVSPGDGYEAYRRGTWFAFTRGFPGFESHISNPWIADNIQQGHGPLGAMYPDVSWGVEGDTPAFLALIPNGLSVPDHPDWGGWGGRYDLYTPDDEEIGVGTNTAGNIPIEPETRPIWTNATDRYTPWGATEYGRSIGPLDETYESNHVTLLRWREAIQNDFAARLDWTTMTVEAANHPPVVRLSHAAMLEARSGQGLVLDAGETLDPDGDSLRYHWCNYAEAGTLDEPVDMGWVVNQPRIYFELPDVTSAQTLHFIVKVTDRGEPALTRYARVIVNVSPD